MITKLPLKPFIAGIGLLFTVFFATAQTAPPKGFTVEGAFKGWKAPKAYLSYFFENKQTVDSAIVENGRFKITGKVTQPSTAWLADNLKAIKTGEGVRFFIENSAIKLSGEANELSKMVVSGSKSNTDLLKLNKIIEPQVNKRNEISKQLNTKTDLGKTPTKEDSIRRKALNDTMDNLDEEILNKRIAFAKTNTNSYISLYQLARIQSKYPEKADSLFKLLNKDIQQSFEAKNIRSLIDYKLGVLVGKTAPNFTLLDINGKSVSLSDYKGSYVLVDFWASWCIPCRRENPNILKAYEKYKDKKFTVLSISIDEQKERWINAVEKDKLPWAQVLDSKNNGTLVGDVYGVEYIPYNFLIDANGKILAHRLIGEDLFNKLNEVLN